MSQIRSARFFALIEVPQRHSRSVALHVCTGARWRGRQMRRPTHDASESTRALSRTNTSVRASAIERCWSHAGGWPQRSQLSRHRERGYRTNDDVRRDVESAAPHATNAGTSGVMFRTAKQHHEMLLAPGRSSCVTPRPRSAGRLRRSLIPDLPSATHIATVPLPRRGLTLRPKKQSC